MSLDTDRLLKADYERHFGVKIHTGIFRDDPLGEFPLRASGGVSAATWTELFDKLQKQKEAGLDQREQDRISALYP